MRNDDVKPDWWCVALDETRHWNLKPETAKHIDKIVGVYFYNEREYTYCCELTPSYHLRFITGSIWFKPDTPEETREQIEDDLSRELYSGDDCYMHVSAVRNIAGEYKHRYGEVEIPKGWTADDVNEEDVVREYYQGNSHF